MLNFQQVVARSSGWQQQFTVLLLAGYSTAPAPMTHTSPVLGRVPVPLQSLATHWSYPKRVSPAGLRINCYRLRDLGACRIKILDSTGPLAVAVVRRVRSSVSAGPVATSAPTGRSRSVAGSQTAVIKHATNNGSAKAGIKKASGHHHKTNRMTGCA
jgi:hypothetical protein